VAYLSSAKSQFTVRYPEGGETTVEVSLGKDLQINFSGRRKAHILRILLPSKPRDVSMDDLTLSEGSAWKYDAKDQRLIIKTKEFGAGHYTITLGAGAAASQ